MKISLKPEKLKKLPQLFSLNKRLTLTRLLPLQLN